MGVKQINIEIADTPQLMAKGLMHREMLDKDSGMLFKFPDFIYASFWGKNTYIPLDVAFIDDRGLIVDVNSIVPLSTKSVHSSFPCKYALEVNAGWLKENGIDVGSQLEIQENDKKVLIK